MLSRCSGLSAIAGRFLVLTGAECRHDLIPVAVSFTWPISKVCVAAMTSNV